MAAAIKRIRPKRPVGEILDGRTIALPAAPADAMQHYIPRRDSTGTGIFIHRVAEKRFLGNWASQ